MFPGCVVAAGGNSPIYPFVVHAELNMFLNCRTIVVSVELSIVDALPSKWRLEVHKSRVSFSYSWMYIYLDHVIIMSQESTSPIVLPS